MRIVPGSDPQRELDALVRHLESHAPWGAQVQVDRVDAVPGFRCPTDGPAYAAARRALEKAYGRAPREAGSGGSIPLLQTLQQAAPNAEFILWGPEDRAAAPARAGCGSVRPGSFWSRRVRGRPGGPSGG
jgi:acetylornithine deacetylase/succinyl-diaminopimelate desuccinylase-like protein